MADLEVTAAVGARGVDVDFTVGAGEVLAVVGPNGAGKSSIAAVIAGLLPADRAVVRVGGRTLTDTGRGLFVPVHHRRVGLLRQDPLLFPHLSVLDNVAFGAGRRSEGRRRALGWLERVGAADLAGRRPAQLSGGEEQRVAVARALAAGPEAVVLDEPLSRLDVTAAAALRAVLRSVLTRDGRPAVLITHDLLDVLVLADRVAVLEGGRIVQVGAVAEVLAAPRTGFAARLAGINAVRGIIDGPAALRCGSQVWHGIAAEPLPQGTAGVAVFSPASVGVFCDRPHGSPRNSVRVRISGLEPASGAIRVLAAGLSEPDAAIAADVTPESVADLGLSVGDRVWFTVKTQEVSLHATGAADRVSS